MIIAFIAHKICHMHRNASQTINQVLEYIDISAPSNLLHDQDRKYARRSRTQPSGSNQYLHDLYASHNHKLDQILRQKFNMTIPESWSR